MSLDGPETKSESTGYDGLYYLHHAFTENSTRWFLKQTISNVQRLLCYEKSSTLAEVLFQPLIHPMKYHNRLLSHAYSQILTFCIRKRQWLYILVWRVGLVETKELLVTKDQPLLQPQNISKNFVNAETS